MKNFIRHSLITAHILMGLSYLRWGAHVFSSFLLLWAICCSVISCPALHAHVQATPTGLSSFCVLTTTLQVPIEALSGSCFRCGGHAFQFLWHLTTGLVVPLAFSFSSPPGTLGPSFSLSFPAFTFSFALSFPFGLPVASGSPPVVPFVTV